MDVVPDSEASRLVRLEAKVEDLDAFVKTMAPLATQVAVLAVNAEHVRDDVKQLERGVHDLEGTFARGLGDMRTEMEKRDEHNEQEKRESIAATEKGRRDLRLALITLIGVIGAAMIAALANILIAYGG